MARKIWIDKRVFLVCIKTARMANGDNRGCISFRQGKAYEIEDTTGDQYVVINEMGDRHYISVGREFLKKHFIVTVEV